MTRPDLPAEAAGDDPGEWSYEGGRWIAAPHLHPDRTKRWDGERWTEWPPREVPQSRRSTDGRWWWDGQQWKPVSTWPRVPPETSPAVPLQQRIDWYVRNGYRVLSQTETAAQLVKPKTFSFPWAAAWFLLCGVGVLVYIFYYASKKDETVYLREEAGRDDLESTT